MCSGRVGGVLPPVILSKEIGCISTHCATCLIIFCLCFVYWEFCGKCWGVLGEKLGAFFHS
jgi:hypothetical protein